MIKTSIGKRALGVAMLACVAVCANVCAQDSGPVATVERLHEALLVNMMRADRQPYQQRYDALAPVIRHTHDFDFMARMAVGRFWSDFSDAQQQQFVDTFTELSIVNYVTRFTGSGQEHFETKGSESLGEKRMLVKSRLVAGNEKHDFKYQLHKTDSGWQIITIIVDGVNDLALKRSQYTQVLESKGFDALIDALKQKIDKREPDAESN